MGRSRMKDTSQTIPFNTNNIIACKRFMEAKIDGILIIMCRKIRLILVCLIAISSLQSQAQALYGTTGLLHAPTAEMQKDKTFMAGGNVLHLVPLQYFNSNEIKYTFNYYLNITILSFLGLKWDIPVPSIMQSMVPLIFRNSLGESTPIRTVPSMLACGCGKKAGGSPGLRR